MSLIKNSQIQKAGYDYQNLYGMDLLIEWFHDPDRMSECH